MWGMAS
jgi:hypothetical protein